MQWFKDVDPSVVISALYDDVRGNVAQATRDVEAIIEAVRVEGDAALRRYTQTFDGVTLATFRVDPQTLKDAYEAMDTPFKTALEKAYINIQRYHEKQQYVPLEVEEDGLYQAQKITPIERVGLYVPGGQARYPSSVLMNAIPATVAGVKRKVVVTPPHADGLDRGVLAALYRCGIDEVYQVGGAQAVAALALGTESIPQVDKVVGPGNLYVALAKQLLSGTIGIDSFAGPSEVMIFADSTADPRFIAADMMAQAEHDVLAKSLVVSTDETLLKAVEEELQRQLPNRTKRKTIAASLEAYAALILVDNDAAALAMINACAPEHLELITQQPKQYLPLIHNAGAIFLGAYTPEAIGDYLGGPNHTLPTHGSARFASGLSTYDFQKRTSILGIDRARFIADAEDVMTLARAEGLEAHEHSVKLRKESL